MGQNSFAENVLQLLLGWLQSLMSGVWSLFSGGSGGIMIRWLSENWLSLLLLFLAAGVILDAVVYLFRWRPFWWWFRKKRMIVDDSLLEDDEDDVFSVRKRTPSPKRKPSTIVPRRRESEKAKKNRMFMEDDLFSVKETKPVKRSAAAPVRTKQASRRSSSIFDIDSGRKSN